MLSEAKAELARLDVRHSYGLEIPLELVRAQIDLAERRANSAMIRLDRIKPSRLSVSLQIEYRQIHAQAFVAKGKPLQAVREWVALDSLTNVGASIIKTKKNHQQLWRNLYSIE